MVASADCPAAPAAAAACGVGPALGRARARRERRRRAEARLRLQLVRDGVALAQHRGGPVHAAGGASSQDAVVAKLRAEVIELTSKCVGLAAALDRLLGGGGAAAAACASTGGVGATGIAGSDLGTMDIDSAVAEETAPAVGARMRLEGLSSAAELNGRVCVVLEQELGRAAGGRIAVEVVAVRGTLFKDVIVQPSRKVRVMRANLVALSDPIIEDAG